MRNNPLSVFPAIVFVLIFAWMLFPQASPAMTPGPIYYKDTGERPPAWFSHARHLSYSKTCGDCHVKIFQKRIGTADAKGAMNMKALEEGKFCGACHNGEDAFTVKGNCSRCHTD